MRKTSLRQSFLASALALAASACAPTGSDEDLPILEQQDSDDGEAVETSSLALTGSPTLYSSLRVVSAEPTSTSYQGGPRPIELYTLSTGTSTIRMLGHNSVVKVVESVNGSGTTTPQNGRYKVEYGHPGAAVWGWIDGARLSLLHAPNPNLSSARTAALARARVGMGFSYWWSHGRWPKGGTSMLPIKNIGKCTPDAGSTGCPKCSHTPTGPIPQGQTKPVEYGSDCSGFVSTVWGFNDTDPETDTDGVGYATAAYSKDVNTKGVEFPWDTIAWSEIAPADAIVKDSAGHIILVGTKPSGTGVFKVYECAGCKQGCLSSEQKISSYNVTPAAWHPIRKKNFPLTL